MKIQFLLRVLLKGLLLGILIPGTSYIVDQKNHPGAGTYDFWEGFLIWTLVSTTISFLGWQVEKYLLHKYEKGAAEKATILETSTSLQR
jgi:hypothetical protein